MVNENSFIARLSGIKKGYYYIDCAGIYRIGEIAKMAGIKAAALKDIYVRNEGEYDKSQDVYYFVDDAKVHKAIEEIIEAIKKDVRGRTISLTEAEIEYIRKALINEGSNTIHLKNKIKDAIFKKLNQ